MAYSPWSFCVRTFGCKVNQYESQSLREAWLSMNGTETDDPAAADVVLLNTCAVTANAVADARQSVHRLNREAPQTGIVIAGCAAEAVREELAALPGVVAVVGQLGKALLLEEPPLMQLARLNASPLLGRLSVRNGSLRPQTEEAASRAFAEKLPDGTADEQTQKCEPAPSGRRYPPFVISGFRRSRPVLKVQDGCSHGCSYCIVPLTRGPARSRAPQDCLDELRRLLDAGFREIMLSGINLRQYAVRDGEVHDFWDLVSWLDSRLAPEWSADARPDPARLRISSVDPAQLTPRGLDCLASTHLVCPHLHISLQSGSAAVLSAMRRAHYSPEGLTDAVRQVTHFWPRFGLGADILMGFPGEEEQHVRETLDVVRALPLTYAHVFPFSARPGTLAASLPGQIEKAERQHRAARVRALVADKGQTFREASLNEERLMVALDHNEEMEDSPAPHGIDACYVPCRLSGPVRESGHALIPVRPLRVERSVLVVEQIIL